MTFEYAAIAIVAFLFLTILVWNTQRVVDKRLIELQDDLRELHFVVSRLFAMVLTANPKAEAGPNVSPADSNGGGVASEDHARTPPSPVLEAELTQVHELCAKLITLVPPAKAAPLLSGQGTSEPPMNRTEGRKPLRAGPLGSPSVKVVRD